MSRFFGCRVDRRYEREREKVERWPREEYEHVVREQHNAPEVSARHKACAYTRVCTRIRGRRLRAIAAAGACAAIR